MIKLIVNADDFGRSPGVNRGVAYAHEHGIVTSASLMVRWPAARAAAQLAFRQPRLDLGLHVDLGEWVYRSGRWLASYQVVPVTDESAIAAEVDRQLAAFRELNGREPTHLDSHQHVHRHTVVATVLARVASQLDIPLRAATPGIGYCGAFFGQTQTGEPLPGNITVAALLDLLATLPAGTTELSCHPALVDDGWSGYGRERTHELRVLCDPRVKRAVAESEIQLSSFRSAGQPLTTQASS
jgi:predicted glycoside hydrolase/deacetylase ChbG (UPF0249 family)